MSESKATILYIDDDQDFLDTMRAILESGGYSMIEAHTGEEGLSVFQARGADLVIVDLMMEEVDSGASFVKELRASGSDVPIYMLSSVGENLNLTVDSADLGLAGVFQKPADRKTILSVLERRFEGAAG